jgi:hypothetical protein
MSDEDDYYMKIIDLDEIYDFLVLNFSFEDLKMLKNIKVQHHNNRILALTTLEK